MAPRVAQHFTNTATTPTVAGPAPKRVQPRPPLPQQANCQPHEMNSLSPLDIHFTHNNIIHNFGQFYKNGKISGAESARHIERVLGGRNPGRGRDDRCNMA